MKKLHFFVASVVGAMALTATAENKPQQTSTERIRVISADDVFDRDVVSSDNQPIGEVEYILVRTNDAKIDYVVIDSEMKSSQDKLLLVPFNAIKEDLNLDRIQLRTSMNDITKAPTIASTEEIATLIGSDKMKQYDTYWAPYSGAGNTPHTGPTGVTETETPETPKTATPQTGTPQPGAPKTGTQKMGSEVGGTASTTTVETGGTTYLLIGERDYRILKAGVTGAGEIGSLEVVGPNQRNLGEIKNVVIDVDHGSVAYTLVSRGGFLGLGMNYVAVPLQAFEFTDQHTLQLKIPFGQFQKMRGYVDDDVPRSVLRSDLERVYKAFKVTPYWKISEKEEVATRES